jgi:hypothetical protein
MAKKNKKLALKKETLRSLSDEQLGAVAGGTILVGLKGYSIVVPPKGTFGCTTEFEYNYDYQGYP